MKDHYFPHECNTIAFEGLKSFHTKKNLEKKYLTPMYNQVIKNGDFHSQKNISWVKHSLQIFLQIRPFSEKIYKFSSGFLL